MDSVDAFQIIDAYRRAFEVANGKTPPKIRYEGGWFRIGDGPGRRKSQIEGMTERLRDRARLTTKQSSDR